MPYFRKLPLFLALGAVLPLLAGCGPSSSATPLEASAKPLSPAEESLLKELEALPPEGRADFTRRHMDEIARFSAGNKTFGERMNAATGATQTKASK